MERLAKLILSHPTVIVAAIVAASIGFGVAASQIQVDPSVEGMIIADDPDLVYYRRFLERFGSDELVIIGFKVPRLFERPALEMIQRISRSLSKITLENDPVHPSPTALIDRVVSLSEVKRINGEVDEGGESSLIIAPFLERLPESEHESRALSARAVADPLYIGNFLAPPPAGDPDAGFTTLILGRIVNREGDLQYRNIVQEQVEEILQREVESGRIETVHLGGTPILKATLGQTAQADVAMVPIYWAVIFGVLFLLFRTAPAVLMPLVTVSLAVVWTTGLMTLCGSHLNIVSGVIRPLILVIGVTTTIHIFSHYYHHAGSVREPRALVRKTLSTVMWPCFLASFTTAVGFVSLGVSKILPVREVGLYSAFGVLAAWLIAVTLVPVLLVRLAPPATKKRRIEGGRVLGTALESLVVVAERFRWPVLLAAGALIGVAVAGISRVKVETDVLRFLERDHPLRVAYRFMRGELGGIDPLDITVTTAPGGLIEPAVLAKIDRLQAWLDEQPEIDHTFSIVDYVKRVNQELHDGDPRYFRLPDSRAQIASALLLLEGSGVTEPFLYPHWEGAEEARVLARVNSSLSGDLVDLIARCQDYLAANVVTDASLLFDRDSEYPGMSGIGVLDTLYYGFRDSLRTLVGRAPDSPPPRDRLENGEVTARVTGVTLLYALMVDRLVDGQISSLILAFAMIWVTVTLVLRSAWAGTIVMIPNLFPILMVLGIMGHSGISLNVGTAMIGSICIGIAVDDTIHFMARYRLRLAEAGSETGAIHATVREVGRPIVTTSLALSLGFYVVSFSSFQPNATFGLLSALTVVIALLGDLVLLPACLLIFRPRIPSPRRVRR